MEWVKKLYSKVTSFFSSDFFKTGFAKLLGIALPIATDYVLLISTKNLTGDEKREEVKKLVLDNLLKSSSVSNEDATSSKINDLLDVAARLAYQTAKEQGVLK